MIKQFILFILITSCANRQFSRNTENPYHTPSTSTEYIQGEIPSWANSSATGKCMRDVSVKYLDFSKVNRSYDMDYKKTVLWQYLYNRFSQQKLGESGQTLIPEQVNSQIFFDSRNKTMSEMDIQKYPQFDTLHVVWIDPLLSDPEALLRFRQLQDQDEFGQGYPVFVSDCLGHASLNKYLDENGWSGMSRYILGAEAFSYFKRDFSPLYRTGLFLSEYFNDRKIVLYGPSLESLNAFVDVENKKEF